MSYNFLRSDNTTPVTVNDEQIDTSQFSVGLVGLNATDYGLTVARNTVHMLENFASDTPPANPVRGQIWYDTSADELKVFSDNAGNTKVLVSIDPTSNGDIEPLSNGVSNIGSPTNKFNVVYANVFDGVATSARYADLAENYKADKEYEPGTVVIIGGSEQVTASKEMGTLDVFGVVSTKPGVLLNADIGNEDGVYVPVALAGQVPVKVDCAVTKGQRLIASDKEGFATVLTEDMLSMINPLAIIGRALEDSNTGTVLAAVGAK